MDWSEDEMREARLMTPFHDRGVNGAAFCWNCKGYAHTGHESNCVMVLAVLPSVRARRLVAEVRGQIPAGCTDITAKLREAERLLEEPTSMDDLAERERGSPR